MKRQVSRASEIVQNVLSALKRQKGFTKEEIADFWKRVVGETGFKHSRPASLRKKILGVCVDSSVWLEELTVKKRFILKKLKTELGREKISEIRFKIGEF